MKIINTPAPAAPVAAFDFATAKEDSALEQLKENRRLERDPASGDMMFVFKTNGGKGSGPQRIPADNILPFLATLKECVDRAGDEGDVDRTQVPAHIQLRNTFSLVKNPGPSRTRTGQVIPAPFGGQDYFEWNSNTGRGNETKGSKPAKLPVGQAHEFMAAFDEFIQQGIQMLVSAGLMGAPAVEDDSEIEDDAADD